MYTYNRPPLTTYQLAILDSPSRITVTEAATKCGKTASHIVWLVEEGLKLKEGQSVWWVAPVFGQAEIAYRRTKRQFEAKQADKRVDICKFNETKLLIILPNGARMEFKSAERPDNLYGEDVYAAVYDEFTRGREASWFALYTTLTATGGKCKLIGNAKGRKNWGHKLGLRAKAGEPDHEYFKITAWDAVEAGILSREIVEQAQRDLPEDVFKELYLAEPTEDGSNPFGLEHIRRQIKPLSVLSPVAYGVDLARKVDWVVIVGLDKYGDICYYSRFQRDWEFTTKEIIRVIRQTPAFIDATGVGDPIVERVRLVCPRAHGIQYTTSTKQNLMLSLAASLQGSETSVLSGTMQDEMESFEFTYTAEGRVKYSAPEGMHDDTVNALALANDCKLKNPPPVIRFD